MRRISGAVDEGRAAAGGGSAPPGSGPAAKWLPRRSSSWWRGVSAVLRMVAAVAALKQDEALADWARALIAVGDMTVDAGKHERS